MQIRSKRQFFDLWRAGCLGNRTQLFDHVYDAMKSWAPRIGFREIGKTGGGAWELVNRVDAPATARRWTELGRVFIMDDSVPKDRSILQGEVCRTELGLVSFLAVGRPLPPMRQSIAAGMHKHRGYGETMLILDRYMDPASREDLNDLLDLYPDHVIEFTSFDVKVGNIPGRRTIMWETRAY